MRKKILIVADDLTGALDSAVAFAERGLRTLVMRRPDALAEALDSDPDILAIATGTRERPVAEAIRIVEAAVAPLADWADIVFKKVDSRLKGHVAEEVDTVARLCGARRAVVAPAIPQFGRVVRNGLLTGHGIDQPIDIAQRLASLGLPFDIPTVTGPADFMPLLAAIDHSVLLVGARGLAAALAQTQPSGDSLVGMVADAPLLVAIGSRDPITLTQVDAVHDVMPVLAAPNGVIAQDRTALDRALLIQMTQGEGLLNSQAASERFSATLAAQAARLRPATIFAAGGETADGLLGAFGVGVLEVAGEFLPGIPLSRFRLGGQRITLITKSGGFGPPDTLQLLLQRVLD